MFKESQKLTAQINSIKKQLEQLPSGTLICARNGKNYKWHIYDPPNTVYLSKKQRVLAEQLALKKYLSLKLNDLVHKQKAIDAFLNCHISETDTAEKLLTENPEYQRLLSSYFRPQNQELSEWMQSDYETNNRFPEQRTHKTVSGNLVRSKSEALIDMILYTNHIPFRYECCLRLNDTVLYPDFTIRHPATGKLYYWEHFGLMDDPVYSKNAFSKLQLYSSHGIIPSINLITTFETQEHPLSSEEIDYTIKRYFL